jgi:mannosyltransferase OCH1-like enzyme
MNPSKTFKSFRRFQFTQIKTLAIFAFVLFASFTSSCGNSDAEPQVKKFCAQVKIGEPVMNVVARAGKVDFDKYWLEKFDKEPSRGEIIGIIRSRDLEKKTENLKKLSSPKKWNHGRFNAMIQELGYSRHVCSVDFAKNKILKKEVLSVD